MAEAGVETFHRAVIAGFGETIYHKRAEDQLTPLAYMIDAARRTVVATRIPREKIDGLAVSSFLMAPENVCTVTEHLGLPVSWTMHGAQGGATSLIQVLRAAEAVERGVAQAVLVLSGDSFTVDAHMALMDRFNAPLRDYVAPFGFGGPNGLFAMMQRRHMHEYGTTCEQMGKIAVTQRRHAMLNDNALLRDELDLEGYLTARLIADPLRLYDCVMPCGGGGGLLVTTPELAALSGLPAIRLVAGAERINHQPQARLMLEGGWAGYSSGLFMRAGKTHSDIDFVQAYDDYPIVVAMQLEDHGFCAKGEGGPFVDATDLSIQGHLPLNTGGGQLSCGQAGAAGGMLGIVEAVRQLQGLGGTRQVEAARVGLVSMIGMVGYGRGLATAALILERD